MKKVAILFIALLTSSFVFAQNTYVPDDKFEQALIDLGYDTTLDDSVLTANISGVTGMLNVSNKQIADLTGIEAFTALTELNCQDNQLTSLDVTANTALTLLRVYDNKLTSLDVTKNTALIELDVHSNLLTSLDVSNNTALINLDCSHNKLTSLDMSNNTVLEALHAQDNQLTSLDVTANTTLLELELQTNKLTSLDVSKNTALTYLDCYGNYLTSLDVTANTALTHLECAYNHRLLASLDVSKNTALIYLSCHDNKLTSLDVSANTALIYLKCSENQLTSLDVNGATALTELHCYNNQLTSLDVSANTALTSLYCGDNDLTSLDVSANTALTNLHFNQNQLTSMDLSKNTALTYLRCDVNQLTSLDVSSNTALIYLETHYNQLTYLNMRNGVTDSLKLFNATNNPNLTCIEVLDPAWATANWVSASGGNIEMDAGVTFAYICGVDVDGVATYNNNGIKAITFNVELPTHSLPDTNISLAFWKSGAENNECTGCNGRDTVSMRKLSDDHWEATVGLDTTLVAGDVGESMYWYHYVKTIPDYKVNEDSERFKSEPNPDGLRQLEPGWHKETSLVNKDTVIAWNNIAPVNFDWVSAASDTIKISQTNVGDTYELKWSESKDVDIDTIEYLLYAQIGVYPAEEVYDTTSTSVQITYEEFLENVFEETPGNGVTVKFSVSATDGKDTVKVSGDDRVVYVNRYEFLSTETDGMPTEFALHENYPNPFNPSTTLRFDLPELRDVNVIIYNMLGQKVKTFNMENISAGHHSIKWNATNDYGDPVGAGVYLYQLQAKDFVKTRKMVLLK